MRLRRLEVTESVRGSFDQARQAVERRCGKVLGKRRLEELVVAAAVDADDFYRARIPVPCSRQMPLVVQVDGEGVVMRPAALREATRRPAAKAAGGHRALLAPGRTGSGCPPWPASSTSGPAEAPSRRDPPARRWKRRAGPKAESKWCTASLVRPPEQVIADAFGQAHEPKHLRPWIVLVDGARHQLDLISAETSRRNVTVHVLVDSVHVAEYVWAAAHAFHKPGTTKAETWAARREAVDVCRHYLVGHLDQLRYDTALDNGWPIATGAVGGACRHLIGDRLDITVARRGLPGAEAILRLRTLLSNGDFDASWRFHPAREPERLCPAPKQRT